MWKNISIFGVPVALALAGLNVYLSMGEPQRPEFIPYDHLRIRTKVKIHHCKVFLTFTIF